MTKKKKPQKKKLNGRIVHSDFEYDLFKQIQAKLPKGATIEYEPEVLDYTIHYTYRPDFVITFRDGRKLYIEAKGNGRQFDSSVKRKMVAVKEQHPDKDIRIVFYKDGKIGPKRKDGSFLKQSDWAQKVKYDFSITDFPEEWAT